MKTRMTIAGLALAALLAAPFAAEAATVRLTIKGGKFIPAASEFESKTLRVEKVVPPGGEVTMQIRPLNPGRYHFFDDFHQETTEGDLVVE
jgi:hypothetical protein